MQVVKCPVCGKSYKQFRFSMRTTCSAKCSSKQKKAGVLSKLTECECCHKMFPQKLSGRRVTCSMDCQKNLVKAKLAELDRMRKKEVESRKKAMEVVKHKYIESTEPRRKCPVCLRRVRVVNSVAGAVWLRAHMHDGELCDGSRSVVSYPIHGVVNNV